MSDPIFSMQIKLTPDCPAADRRAKARYTLNLPAAFCHPIAEQMSETTWEAARGHDISSTGIGLSLTQPIEPGTLLAIDLEGISRLLLAHVMHATLQADGRFLVGCEFINPLSEEELLAVC